MEDINTTHGNDGEIKVSPKFQPFLTPIAVIVAGVIIAMAIRSDGGTVKTPTQGGDTKQVVVDIKKVNITNDPFIGQKNAPVVVAYWSDYQCPFCKKFEVETLTPLIKEYVDTGKVKVVFKDYQFLSEDSDTAGLYGRAVWDLYPAQYFVWREAVFAKQDQEHGGFGDDATLYALTKTISGIDADKVKNRIVSNKDAYMKELTGDKNEGTSFGISGTPGFIIGTKAIPGAAPYATFKQLIDAELAK